MEALLIFLGIGFISLVIWRASNGFEAASAYLGRNLSDGVRGATINAIGSSIPELLTTMFFLIIAPNRDGLAGGLATTAGSAVFNGMIIPGLVILTVTTFAVKKLKSISISRRVLIRDGLSLVLFEFLLIILISTNQLAWWHGAILVGMYAVYIIFIFSTMSRNELSSNSYDPDDELKEIKESSGGFFKDALTLNISPIIVGKGLNTRSAWWLLIVSSLVISIACFFLVESCILLGDALNLPIYFIAVVLASAATSVPDTILSLKDAKKGNYEDAISNALGSNIFDISFSLGMPLLVYTLMYGTIEMDTRTITDINELRVLLLILTIATLLVLAFHKKVFRINGIILIGFYCFFLFFVLGKSVNHPLEQAVSSSLERVIYLIYDWVGII